MPLGLKGLLGLGLKFCPTPSPVQSSVYIEALLPLFRSIRLGLMFKENNQSYSKLIYVPNSAYQPQPAPQYIEGFMKYCLKKAQTTTQYSTRPAQFNLNRRMRTLLREMRGQQELKILQTDKNLGPAIMTCKQYKQFCMQHLEQADTYKRVNEIPLAEIKKTVAAYHTALCRASPYLVKEGKIIIHGLETSTPAYFHALPKIHKTPMGCRPIVSSINAPTTGLSKWLTHVLTPIATQIQSYVRDSDTLQGELTQLTVEPTDILYTFDVENMYTSIPIEEALHAIRWFLNRMQHPLVNLLLYGLRIVLEYNFFTFGDSNWKQLRGLAMGTPVAPILAMLYLGYHEETKILSLCKQSLRLYKRYLDDILLVWRPDPTNPYLFNRFRAILRQTPGLSWTYKEHKEQAPFLDLCIFRHGPTYATRTHQKLLNLYLYPTFNSAHAPTVKKGMIYGLLKKYKTQNTLPEDFQALCRALFQRFLTRGYRSATLRPLFQNALERLSAHHQIPQSRSIQRQYFYKIPYDPNGPSRSRLRTILALDELSKVLSATENAKITICYQKPNNLGNKLTRTKTTADPPSALAALENFQDALQDSGAQ